MATISGDGYFTNSSLSAPTATKFTALVVAGIERMRWPVPNDLTTSNNIGVQTKPAATATTTASVIGAEVQPRVNSGIGAGALVGMNVGPILKGSSGGGNVTDMRGMEVELTDDNPATSTRTITTCTMVRLRHQLASVHTITNGIVGIDWIAAGARAWTFAMKFADDGGTGLADLASAVATVNGVIKVQIGSTTCYIPTYASYTPS